MKREDRCIVDNCRKKVTVYRGFKGLFCEKHFAELEIVDVDTDHLFGSHRWALMLVAAVGLLVVVVFL